MEVSEGRSRYAKSADGGGDVMKRIVKKYYNGVQLSPEKKQEMLSAILAAKHRPVRRRAWMAAAVVAAAVVLAIVLPLALGNRSNDSAGDSVAASETMRPEAAQGPKAQDYTTAIVLSLNPEVEFRLDADGGVTEVVGRNDDGVALVDSIDFAGMSLENATIMVVNQLILQGYITAAEIQEEINISLASDTMTLDTLSVMTDIIKTAAAEQNIAVDVIQDADTNSLQIVLEGEGNPDVWPELVPEEGVDDTPPDENTTDENADVEEDVNGEDLDIGLEMEFAMQGGTHSAYVEDILIHTREGETIGNLQDFAATRLNQAALRSIIELIDKGYITDAGSADAVRFYFTGDISGSEITALADMTQLLMAEYDLHIAVTADTEAKDIRLVSDDTVTHDAQVSKFAIKDVLNTMVNKDEEDLSPRQIAILKAAYNYREYQRLLERRYFVVVPDLVGLSEQQAVNMLQQVGLVPVVVREKVAGYDPEQKDGGFASPSEDTEDMSSEGLPPPADDWADQPREWEYPVVDFGCVFYQDGPAGGTCQTNLPMQINVIVSTDDDRPEVTDYRDDSGIVIRDMDVPFDVSAYPDTFSLSDVSGFGTMIDEMNATYTIEDKADYTVTIDRDTGWENTTVITITHQDGFPMSKFFAQDGRIIEHEFVWRRDAPTAEDAG